MSGTALGERAEQPPRDLAFAYAMLVVAMLCWASNFVVARAVGDEVPPLGLSLMRWVVASGVILPFTAREIFVKRAVLRRDWRLLSLLGLLGISLSNGLAYIGLTRTTVINAGLVNSAAPIIIPLAAFALFRERLRPRRLMGTSVSLLGVAIIVLRGRLDAIGALSLNLGDLCVLGGIVGWSIYSVLLRRRPPELSPLALLSVLFAIGAITLLPLHLAWDGGWLGAPARPLIFVPRTMAAYLFVGLAPAVGAYLCWNRAVVVLGATRAGIFNHLMPVFSAGLAWLFLGEQIEPFHLAGAALISLGIVLAGR